MKRYNSKTYNKRYPGLKTNINPFQRMVSGTTAHQVLDAIYRGAHTFEQIHELTRNDWIQNGYLIEAKYYSLKHRYLFRAYPVRSEINNALTRLEATGLIQNTTPGTNIYHSIFVITYEGNEAIKYFNKTQSNLIIE